MQLLPIAAINAVKAVSTTTPPVNNGDGTFDVTYELIVQNTGGISLTNIVFTDLPSANLASANVGIVTQPNITASTATVDPTLGNYPNLFTGGGTLAPGETANVSYVFQVDPSLAADPNAMTNQASVTGENPAAPGIVAAMDASDSGTDPTNDNRVHRVTVLVRIQTMTQRHYF